MKIKKLLLSASILYWISACQPSDNQLKVDVSKIPAKVVVKRFDQDFFGNKPEQFSEIQKKYPYLLSDKVPDSVWIKKMQDSLLLELKKQVDSVYPDFEAYKKPVENLFKHIKYYQKDFKEPVIVTIYSDWNYMTRAVYADSLELLSLDNFLGADNPMYKGIPQYIRQNLIPERIPVEIANSITEQQVKPVKKNTFLDRMIYYGKKLYLLDAYLPETADSLKIGYTEKKLQWAYDNEKYVWEYFVEQKLLYNHGKNLDMRFLNTAPYSKFYTEEDMNSPGRIGQFIGWQIVRSFMKKNKVSLQKMMQMPEEEIFKQSKYKPKK